MRYTLLRQDGFKELAINAGVLCESFEPTTGTVDKSSILALTSGGISFASTPSFTDNGADVDNCPANTMELKQLDSREVKLTGTFVSITAALAARLDAAADVDDDGKTVTPRADLSSDDFKELWLVGDYSDKTGPTKGGAIAIHMLNTLSTGGFQFSTQSKGKGKFPFTFIAHYSMDDPETQPYEIYIAAGEAEAAAASTTHLTGNGEEAPDETV